MLSLMRSRLFQLALALLLAQAFALGAHAADTDGDGIEDGVDKCPYTWDDQNSDVGGVGPGSAPDGIGDVCQCGDADDDGFVTEDDALAIKEAALSLDPYMASVGLPGFEKCDVGGTEGCSGLDGSIVTRTVNGLAPALQQSCPAASAAVTNNLSLAVMVGASFASGDGASGPIGLLGPDVQLGHPVAVRIGIQATQATSNVTVQFFICPSMGR